MELRRLNRILRWSKIIAEIIPFLIELRKVLTIFQFGTLIVAFVVLIKLNGSESSKWFWFSACLGIANMIVRLSKEFLDENPTKFKEQMRCIAQRMREYDSEFDFRTGEPWLKKEVA